VINLYVPDAGRGLEMDMVCRIGDPFVHLGHHPL
jgi:hypothetical protein